MCLISYAVISTANEDSSLSVLVSSHLHWCLRVCKYVHRKCVTSNNTWILALLGGVSERESTISVCEKNMNKCTQKQVYSTNKTR